MPVDHQNLRVLLPCLALLICGCEKTAELDRSAKLEQVRTQAVKLARVEDRAVFAAAKLVHGLQDFPVDVVGLKVPLPDSTNSVFVTFQLDHFDEHTVEQLAAEAVNDYQRAKDDRSSEEPSQAKDSAPG